MWSGHKPLVPVPCLSLILTPSLLVLFLYYVEIRQLSRYLHVTLELDPKMWLLELRIQNSVSPAHSCTFVRHLPDDLYPPFFTCYPLDGSRTTLMEMGVQKTWFLGLLLSSSENTSFMVTAYLNYYVPCLSWLCLCRFYLQSPSCEISVMCVFYLTWASRN